MSRKDTPWPEAELRPIRDRPKHFLFGDPMQLRPNLAASLRFSGPERDLVPLPGRVRARVLSVYDGDTFTCVVPVPHARCFRVIRVRMLGYDAPEMRQSKDQAETTRIRNRGRAVACRNRLRDLVLARNVWLDLKGSGKYGRTLARVFLLPRSQDSVNDLIRAMPGCVQMDAKGRRLVESDTQTGALPKPKKTDTRESEACC